MRMNDDALLVSAVRQMAGQNPSQQSRSLRATNEALRSMAESAMAAYEYGAKLQAQRDVLRELIQELVDSVEGGGNVVTITDVKLAEYRAALEGGK